MKQTIIPAALAALLIALARPASGQAPAPAPAAPPGDSLRLKVDGMVCSLCAYGAERRLKKIGQLEEVKVQLDSGVVVVLLKPGAAVGDSVLAEEIRKAGFALRSVERFTRRSKEPGGE